MTSVLDVPALQGPPDIGAALQMLSEGLADRRKNREEETKRLLAQNIGGSLSSGDFQGAANTAFASGDMSSGLKIHEMGIEGKKQFAEKVVRYISLATPENYPKLRQTLIDLTGQDPGPDLDAAKTDILGEYADIENLMSEHESATDNARADAQLGISQEQLQLDKDKAARDAAAVEKPKEGYRWKADGVTQEFIPGGSADPAIIELNYRLRRPQMTAADKKAVMEADDLVLAGENTVGMLNRAIELSDKALSGYTAGVRGYAGANLPDWAVSDFVAPKDAALATEELDNLITAQALEQLRATFGSMPTEGERKILLEIQGSVGKDPKTRKNIYERSLALAKKRIEFNRQRAADLRGGTFYDEQGNVEDMVAGEEDMPDGVDPDLWRFLTPEERQQYRDAE